MALTVTYIETQITSIEALVVLYMDVLTRLAATPNKSYTINTGQTVETVNKRSVPEIMKSLDALNYQLDYWKSQLAGDSAIVVGIC